MKHFLNYFDETIKKYWKEPALTNFHGATYSYADVAIRIEKLHLLFEGVGVMPGDKVAVTGKNTAEWAMTFLAVNTYHAVAVPLLANFTAEGLTNLTAHSESKLLFCDTKIFKSGIDPTKIEGLKMVISLDGYEVLYSSDESYSKLWEDIDTAFVKKYPKGFTKKDIDYTSEETEELCIISYTSGTTGNPKGIMIPARAISANIDFGQRTVPSSPRNNNISMLPLAHMFGFVYEFLYPFLGGAHIFFLSKTPTPSILMQAFAEVRPYLLVTVPLVMEKLIKGKVMPVLKKPIMRIAINIPFFREMIFKYLKRKLMKAFGGKVMLIPMGGAAISQPVEKLMKKIGLPYTVGYGMTECAPLVCYSDWKTYAFGSCGRPIDTLSLRIDSVNPTKVVGEVQLRGANIMTGYYKDPEATAAAFTPDGWMRTGDLGILDKKGNVYLKGRSKCMILTANGQNIYPEEIESRLNDLDHVAESLVIERDRSLIALIALKDDVDIENFETVEQVANEVRTRVNKDLPKYSQIAKVEVLKHGFEHTPKNSIKRNLYQ